MIEICKWYQNALSPVVLMVDDFCNVWVDTNGNGVVDLGEDWGYARRGPGSSLVFLEDEVLKGFPLVKVTFFVPVGIRAGVIENSDVPYVSQMINCDSRSREFFRSVGEDPRYEVAYHGTTHGQAGKEANDFIQEWATFENLAQAKNVIHSGRETFQEVFGVYPTGGKYCGYVSNDFSDDSIEQSGFSWWCRYSNVSLYEDEHCTIGGQDYNRLTNFDVKYFGRTNVVDVPTTLNGGLLTSLFHPGAYNLKGLLKRILKPLLLKIKLKRVGFLLKNRLVICVQEHIAPARLDGKRQMPNIFDDRESLRTILQYLKKQRVWYCTCSELVEYSVARDSTTIELHSENCFKIHTKVPRSVGSTLTLRINSGWVSKIIQPDGAEVAVLNQLADIKVSKGVYTLS